MSEQASATATEESSSSTKRSTQRHFLTKRNSLLLLLTVAAGAVAIVMFRSESSTASTDEVSPSAKPLPVSIFEVQRFNNYLRQRDYTGILQEARRSQLGFQRAGEVIELLVDEGQAVSDNQVIAKLDTRHIEAREQQFEAQRLEAVAVLRELINGPRSETIAAKRAELETLRAQSKVLEKQLARREKLVQGNSVSREEYESYLHQAEAAAARVDMVNRQLDELVTGTREEQKAAQQARIDQLDAMLADVKHDLDDAELRAPYAGRVAARMIDEGAVIQAGAPVVELVDSTNLEAWVGLPVATAAGLSPGSVHTLLVDGLSVQATVHSLAPEVDRATRTRNVIFKLSADQAAAPQGSVLPGQVFRFAAEQRVEKSGFWVPTTALTRSTRGLWSVYVVVPAEEVETPTSGSSENTPGSIIARRDVELLDTVDEQCFVRGTLRSGDRVVSSGTHRVVTGQRVTTDDDAMAMRAGENQ
ncbi:efflux RND transporter periplasmic adaptor subunit [Adhaeretor mobilis]|uniref:Toluene efflux pump periplasmic linker protein TtgD n=1 Tax=Adhaeretor mobilis TaxID=1930276 RepID=A0A517MR62_9BACT|nr:efflux RND transporter periplasmic adaptor subunit [Adhaeretor mobilis]QDS97365.1 Toluene efflux pump periplasmic linker protein TtgD precursor [Adhaeretor mobilis]